VNLRRASNGVSWYPLSTERVLGSECQMLEEDAFRRMISLERKRSERSGKPFVLMLVDAGTSSAHKHHKLLLNTARVLSSSTRETDITGWYKHGSIIGVMFTELILEDKGSILTTMCSRVSATLKKALTIDEFNKINLSFHFFPDDWDDSVAPPSGNLTLYPDLAERDRLHRPFHVIKRTMDIVGSMAALMLLSPLFLLLAIIIKATSKGPVFFRQVRVGQHGKPFVFLKFRSMHAVNDARIHQEYVKQLIAGTAEKQPSNANGTGAYKLTNDPRVTTVGAFLRRTSLDELPQFINVLMGEMSLVGPRPPVEYEVEAYDIWHRRRLVEAKPGITGLWQVNGRSRVKFDEMVRLDLKYARTWTPWMDLKILLRTPGAVVLGEGAH
jgi:lipopolysaccharide/colanic/teichoic acid biosynthesis glycosyltransferase